jgi:hypothetical protein
MAVGHTVLKLGEGKVIGLPKTQESLWLELKGVSNEADTLFWKGLSFFCQSARSDEKMRWVGIR